MKTRSPFAGILRSALWRRALVAALFTSSAGPALAHDAPAKTPAYTPTKIVTLGTAGGPGIRKHRSQPATLLVVEGTPYLFDCGSGTVRQLASAGIAPSSVRAVFISHNHADHNLGLAEWMGNSKAFALLWSIRDHHWPIYGPAGTHAMVKAADDYSVPGFTAFVESDLISKSHFAARQDLFSSHEMAPGVVYRDDLVEVTAVENSHYDLMSAASRETHKSFSFKVRTKDAVIVITGDTGKSEAVTELARDADVIVTEALDFTRMADLLTRRARVSGLSADELRMRIEHMRVQHIDLRDIGETMRDTGVKSIILTHLGSEMDELSDEQIIAPVKLSYSGQVFAAHDLNQYCIKPAAERAGGALTAC